MKRLFAIALTMSMLAPSAQLAAQGALVERSPEYWFAYAEKLPIGSTVRVRTTDGKRQTAVLAVVDRDGITLEPKTRVPERPRRVTFDQIEQLELKQNGSSLAKAVAIGSAVGAGTFFGILMLVFAAANWD